MHTKMHTNMHTKMHTKIHTKMHTKMYTKMYTNIYTKINTCINTAAVSIHSCIRAYSERDICRYVEKNRRKEKRREKHFDIFPKRVLKSISWSRSGGIVFIISFKKIFNGWNTYFDRTLCSCLFTLSVFYIRYFKLWTKFTKCLIVQVEGWVL
jgi:hypothetical protein